MKYLIRLVIPALILASILYVGCKDDSVSPQQANKPTMERRSATMISYANSDNPENGYGDDALELFEEFMQGHYANELIYQDGNDSVYTDSTEANMLAIADDLWSGYSTPPAEILDGYNDYQELVAKTPDLSTALSNLHTDSYLTSTQLSLADDYFSTLYASDSVSLETVVDSLKTLEDEVDGHGSLTSNEKRELLKASAACRIIVSYFYNVDQGFETGEPANALVDIIGEITDDTEINLNAVAISMGQNAYVQSIRGMAFSDEDGLYSASVSVIWEMITFDNDRVFRVKKDGCPCIVKKSVDGSSTECCCDNVAKSKCKCSSGCSSASSGVSTSTF